MLVVPPSFAKRRIQVSGDEGRAWIESLPERVEHLCRQWNLSISGSPMTGELGLVVPVDRGSEEFALKVAWPDEDSKDEARALSAWNGQGAVRLIAVDEEAGALLMERADHRRPLSSIPVDEAVLIAGRLLRTLAIPAPKGLPTQAQTATQMARKFVDQSEALGRPVPEPLLDLSLRILVGIGETGEQRLINTDLHYDNVLAAKRSPWLAIDPKVMVGEVEFGLAPLLWNLYRREPLDRLAEHFEALVQASGCHPERARQVTLVRLVSYWLWAVETGLTEDPKMCRDLTGLLS